MVPEIGLEPTPNIYRGILSSSLAQSQFNGEYEDGTINDRLQAPPFSNSSLHE